jgi:hypothetical protein
VTVSPGHGPVTVVDDDESRRGGARPPASTTTTAAAAAATELIRLPPGYITLPQPVLKNNIFWPDQRATDQELNA